MYMRWEKTYFNVINTGYVYAPSAKCSIIIAYTFSHFETHMQVSPSLINLPSLGLALITSGFALGD
jgi:hypothetical protein